jgi:Tfp pilus assembly protein PilO
MKLQMTSASKAIVAMLIVAALAVAFWVLALGPKRDEAKKLGAQISQLKSSLAAHHAEVVEAEDAREEFPVNYQQLVVLGKAVPGDDDTASLLVQLNTIAKRSKVRFSDFALSASGGGSAPPPAAGSASGGSSATPASNPVSPTEAAASLMPLGATIGPAGLAVMPYELTFSGSFFRLADFIKGLDSLVKTTNEQVDVSGRLITIDGFSLEADSNFGFPRLQASFEVTTYLTPPEEGVTAGATPAGPGSGTATPASTTLGGTP